jgi:hypothetical protein
VEGAERMLVPSPLFSNLGKACVLYGHDYMIITIYRD